MQAYDISNRTFKQVAESYLAKVRGTIASTTYDRYLDALERDVYPEYANKPMMEVTEAEVKHFIKVAPEVAAKRGRSLTNSSLLVIKAVMSNVINYANAVSGTTKAGITINRTSYEELTIGEIEQICLKARYNHCPEMLAVLLSLYCGMRTGELSAINSDDVNTERNEIYIHETAHRVRNPNRGKFGEKKTIVIVEDIPWKKQIRRVKYPEVLTDYIKEFQKKGKPLIRNMRDDLVDPRTLENWLIRIMKALHIEGINFERIRKTYLNGNSNERVLNNIFLGIHSHTSYAGMNQQWKGLELEIKQIATFIENEIWEDGTRVGFVELCPERHEISRIKILEPYKNKGYEASVLETLTSQGYTSIWVKLEDSQAIQIYEKCGFKGDPPYVYE